MGLYLRVEYHIVLTLMLKRWSWISSANVSTGFKLFYNFVLIIRFSQEYLRPNLNQHEFLIHKQTHRISFFSLVLVHTFPLLITHSEGMLRTRKDDGAVMTKPYHNHKDKKLERFWSLQMIHTLITHFDNINLIT